jgi:CDGSH iron-sulfur domain-containing protein 3
MKIKAVANGPLLIETSEAIIIKDGKEEILSQKTIALCRCGQSLKKPFCNGAHKKFDFSGDVVELEIK